MLLHGLYGVRIVERSCRPWAMDRHSQRLVHSGGGGDGSTIWGRRVICVGAMPSGSGRTTGVVAA